MILRSIITTLSVSTLFALGLMALVPFWKTFFVMIGLQVIIFGVASYLISYLVWRKREELELQAYQVENQQYVTTSCPCSPDKHVNIRFFTNKDNIFTCDRCKKNIKLLASYTPVVLTTIADNHILDTVIPNKEQY